MDSIAAAYEALPRQLKSIARYFEQHRSSVMMDRVTDIAVACDVHPSAVVRFSKRFGFSGFSEMQAIFRRAYTERVAPIQSYQQRIRNLVTNTRTRLRGSEIAGEFIDGKPARPGGTRIRPSQNRIGATGNHVARVVARCMAREIWTGTMGKKTGGGRRTHCSSCGAWRSRPARCATKLVGQPAVRHRSTCRATARRGLSPDQVKTLERCRDDKIIGAF